MRILSIAIAVLALSFGSGAALAECGAHQAKSGEVASTSSKPLVDRLAALAQSRGVEIKTQ
jgi:hypothetical protein